MSPNKHEAESAATEAIKLIRKHRLTKAEVAEPEEDPDPVVIDTITDHKDHKVPAWCHNLAIVVAISRECQIAIAAHGTLLIRGRRSGVIDAKKVHRELRSQEEVVLGAINDAGHVEMHGYGFVAAIYARVVGNEPPAPPPPVEMKNANGAPPPIISPATPLPMETPPLPVYKTAYDHGYDFGMQVKVARYTRPKFMQKRPKPRKGSGLLLAASATS